MNYPIQGPMPSEEPEREPVKVPLDAEIKEPRFLGIDWAEGYGPGETLGKVLPPALWKMPEGGLGKLRFLSPLPSLADIEYTRPPKPSTFLGYEVVEVPGLPDDKAALVSVEQVEACILCNMGSTPVKFSALEVAIGSRLEEAMRKQEQASRQAFGANSPIQAGVAALAEGLQRVTLSFKTASRAWGELLKAMTTPRRKRYPRKLKKRLKKAGLWSPSMRSWKRGPEKD